MSQEQISFYNSMNKVISDPNQLPINVVDANDPMSHNVLVGNCGCYSGSPVTTHTIDIDDINSFGNGGALTSRGWIAHEIIEAFELRVNHATVGDAHYIKARAAENGANGVDRVIRPGVPEKSVNSGTVTTNTSIVKLSQNEKPKKVEIQFTNGNVSNVKNNKKH